MGGFYLQTHYFYQMEWRLIFTGSRGSAIAWCLQNSVRLNTRIHNPDRKQRPTIASAIPIFNFRRHNGFSWIFLAILGVILSVTITSYFLDIFFIPDFCDDVKPVFLFPKSPEYLCISRSVFPRWSCPFNTRILTKWTQRWSHDLSKSLDKMVWRIYHLSGSLAKR